MGRAFVNQVELMALGEIAFIESQLSYITPILNCGMILVMWTRQGCLYATYGCIIHLSNSPPSITLGQDIIQIIV